MLFRSGRWIEADDLSAHALQPEALASIEAALGRAPRLQAAWVVRLHAGCGQLQARHAIIVEHRRRVLPWRRDARMRADQQALATAIGECAQLIDLHDLNLSARARLHAMWGTRLV